jgi:hypothetical protein
VLANSLVLDGAPFHAQPSKLEILDADVGMAEQVCLMSGSLQQFVGHCAGLDEAMDSAGRTAAHGPTIAGISSIYHTTIGPRCCGGSWTG